MTIENEIIVDFKSISKEFGSTFSQDWALKGINFSIKKGRIFGIIGRSGAGKSTLLRMINGLERPSLGSMVVHREALESLSKKQLRAKRKSMGVIFQHFNLVSTKTAFENIAIPLQFLNQPKSVIENRVNELLDRVGLGDLADRYPDQLSGGQRQRVAIARALATDPEILLCDEATSALDPESTQSILKLLQSLNRELGITIVLITHEMEVVKSICHDVAVLDGGILVEEGSVVQIFSQPKSPITRNLTQKASHQELPFALTEKLSTTPQEGQYPLFRLTFVGNVTNEPISVILLEKFSVKVNILLADVEYFSDLNGDIQVGFLLSQFMGEAVDIDRAVDHLKSQSISVEKVGYVAF